MARPRLVWGIRVPSDRWKALTALAAEDLSVARLAEGHADAVAILSELDGLLSRPGPSHHHNGSGLRTFGAVGGPGDAPRSGTARDLPVGVRRHPQAAGLCAARLRTMPGMLFMVPLRRTEILSGSLPRLAAASQARPSPRG